MPVIPVLKPQAVVKTFSKFGWEIARQRGSHIIMTKEKHPATLSIPKHTQVARGTLRSLLSRAEITIDDFLNALEN